MTASVTDDIAAGMAARHEGQADVLAADQAIHRGYADLVPDAVAAVGAHGLTFTAEDLRAWISEHHPNAVEHHPNVLPAALGGLASAGRITGVGHVQCTRTSRRAGWMRAWRITPTTSAATP